MTGELTVKRLAPLDATSDAMWKWFIDHPRQRHVGRQPQRRAQGRVVVIYDTTLTEISRWNFYDAWPSKIASDGFEVTKNDPVAETITLQYEKLERKK